MKRIVLLICKNIFSIVGILVAISLLVAVILKNNFLYDMKNYSYYFFTITGVYLGMLLVKYCSAFIKKYK